jgi:WD40 repeat protein
LARRLTPDGRRPISGSRDGTLRIWDLEVGGPPRVLEGHTGGVRAVAVTPDGRRAASGAGDRTLRVWDVDSGQILASFSTDAEVVSCGIATDGLTLVGGDAAGRVHLLRLEGV